MKTIQIMILLLIQVIQFSKIAQSTQQKSIWYIGSKIGLPQYNNIITYIDKLIIYNNIHDSIHSSHIGCGNIIGYHNNQYFDFELSYNWLGKVTYATETINSTFKIQNIDISTKLYYPIIKNKINIYTKLGGAIWHANIKNTYFNNHDTYSLYIHDTNIAPLLSTGIEYEITQRWTTRIEYQKIKKIGNTNTLGVESNHSFFNLSILYHFK